MNLLIIGDIFGQPGREALKALLPQIQAEHNIDFTVVNGENATHGKGLSPKNMSEILASGANFITTGNHIWSKKEIYEVLDDGKSPIIRPANFVGTFEKMVVPGRGHAIVHTKSDQKILIINLMGTVFNSMQVNCPFRTVDSILQLYAHEDFAAIIVDFHAETTSEKAAMGHFLDGRATVVFGTHTHVPTADYRILSKATAFISDIGMTGVYDSVIGLDKEKIIERFITQMPHKAEVATGKVDLFALKVTTGNSGIGAESIEFIHKTYPR